MTIKFVPANPSGQVAFQPLAPQGDLYVAEGRNWEQAIKTSSSQNYKWSTDTTATDPTAGFAKVNNADLSLVTEVYISETTLTGGSIESVGELLLPGELIRIQQFGATGNYVYLKVDGESIDNGGWWSIPVESLSTNGGFVSGVDIQFDLWTFAARETITLESLPESSTTESYLLNPQVKLNENFTTNYTKALITFCFEPSVDATNRSCVVDIVINGTQFEDEFYKESKNVSDGVPYSKTFPYDFALTGSQNITVNFGRAGGGGGAFVNLKNVRVFIRQRVDG